MVELKRGTAAGALLPSEKKEIEEVASSCQNNLCKVMPTKGSGHSSNQE